MWQYIINIVFYPFTWLWNNVMNVSIYGVKPVQIFALIAFGMALYRFIIIPFSTQFSVSAELPANIGRLANGVEYRLDKLNRSSVRSGQSNTTTIKKYYAYKDGKYTLRGVSKGSSDKTWTSE